MGAVLRALFATLLFLLMQSLPLFESLPLLSAAVKSGLAMALPYLVCKTAKMQIPFGFLSKKPPKKQLAYLLLLPAFVFLTFGLSAFCGWVGKFFQMTLPVYKGNIAFLLLLHALFPALTEEFCFRCVVPNLLAPLGQRAVLFGSALLFALAHISPVMMVYALVAGILLGLLREVADSPLLPMLFHFCNNAFCLVLMQFDITFSWTVLFIGLGVGILGVGILFFTRKDLFFDFFSPLYGRADREERQNG